MPYPTYEIKMFKLKPAHLQLPKASLARKLCTAAPPHRHGLPTTELGTIQPPESPPFFQ